MVLTDPGLSGSQPMQTVRESLEKEGVGYTVFDQVAVEPTDGSVKSAIDFGQTEPFDAFLAVGGGSSIDTAKLVDLYTTYPPEHFLDYVNAPVGKGKPVPGALKPLFAIPTTAGTGSETTGQAIFDLEELHAKTGVSHRRLKPTLGIVDPDHLRTLPAMVRAATGLDVLTHAVESYTAIPYDTRPLPERPVLRPAYQGSNPVSDIWSLEAMRMVSTWLVRAVEDPEDDEAQTMMAFAASFAGVGFGNAGVALPHGMSYPVSGMVREYRAEGYPAEPPACPPRHRRGGECPRGFPLYRARVSGAPSEGSGGTGGGCLARQAGGRGHGSSRSA